MWTYEQGSGRLLHNGILIGTGYSGHATGIDNTALEDIPYVGPLPRGIYSIAAPIDHPRLGPCSLPLTQISGDSFGRSAFFIHGDNSLGNDSASEGCIIMPRAVRDQIATSGDNQLTVVA